MFKEIRIKSYRGLKDIELSDLGQINIIVGENNSGKTSILEAIQLFDNKDVLSEMISIAQKRESQFTVGFRGNLLPFDTFLYSFPMKEDVYKEVYLEAYSDQYGDCRVGVRGEMHRDIFSEEDLLRSEANRYRMYCDEDGFVRVIQGSYLYERDTRVCDDFIFSEIQLRPKKEHDSRFNRNLGRKERGIMYISPMDIYTNKVISASLYKGMLVEEKQRLLDLLKLFDERVIGIETSVSNGKPITMIELEDCGLVPLSVFGDGLKKILTLASAVVKMRDGIVLIDEFETGIHKRALMQVADWLAAVTERYNVQIFMTTHSSDALDALVEIEDANNKIRAYRIEHYRDKIYVKKFYGKDMYSLKNDQGINIL